MYVVLSIESLEKATGLLIRNYVKSDVQSDRNLTRGVGQFLSGP